MSDCWAQIGQEIYYFIMDLKIIYLNSENINYVESVFNTLFYSIVTSHGW